MLQFGRKSKAELETVHPSLKLVMTESLRMELIDFSVLQGHRGKEEQDRYFKLGKSKVKFPNGKHNSMPSLAVDVVPFIKYKISWNPVHCIFLAGVVLTCAKNLGIGLRWGGNWDRDLEIMTDQDFNDLVHYELSEV